MKEFRYSAIDAAHSCLQKYKYVYVDGIRSADTLDMAFGSAIHLSIQAYFEGDLPLSTFELFWNTTKELPQNKISWDEYNEMGEVFLTRWVRLHSKYYRPLHVEKLITIDFADNKLSGTPDFIGYYKDKLCVVDFKTASYEYPKAKLQINEQMFIYAYMASIKYNLDITDLVYCVFVKNPEPRIQVISIELTKPKLLSMLENVTLMVKDLSVRESFPKNRNSCILGKDYKCSFYGRCYENA